MVREDVIVQQAEALTTSWEEACLCPTCAGFGDLIEFHEGYPEPATLCPDCNGSGQRRPRSRWWQPFPGATILCDGESYWGTFHCAGVYIADPALCRRAQKILLERDHLEALRRNDWMDRQRLQFEVTDYGHAALDARVA